jgi:prevent-host-death family protein
MTDISISEAKSRFSELVSRVVGGERFLIQRRQRPLAALISIDELERMERSGQAARRLAQALGQRAEILDQIEAGKAHPAMAAFGLWRDEEDLDDIASEITESRRQQTDRSYLS